MRYQTSILTILLILFNCTWVLGQAKPTYTIGILIEEWSAQYEVDITNFEEEIQGVVGDKVKIEIKLEHVLSSDHEYDRALENYQSLVNNNNVDLIISIGPVNNYMLNKITSFKKPMIIYGQIDTDFSEIENNGRLSEIKNLSYVVIPQSMKTDIEEFYNLYNFSSLGILVDGKIYDSLSGKTSLQSTINKNLKSAPFTAVTIPLHDIDQLESSLDSVDAVFISIGLYRSPEEYKAISDLFIKKKIPSFSTIGQFTTNSGFLLSKGNEGDEIQIRRRIALNIEDIVNGTPPEEIPIYMKDDRRTFYNFETAARIGFEPKKSALSKFVMVGNLDQLNFGEKYSLEDMLRQVYSQNLSLRSEKENIVLSEKETKIAKSQYLPQVSVSNSLSTTDYEVATSLLGGEKWQNGATAQVDQTIYSQEASSAIAIAKLSELATQHDYNTDLLNELSDLSNNFFSALIAKTNYLIEFENFELTRQNYNIAKQNFESGETGKADVLRWESEMAKCSQRMVSFWSNQQNALEVLNQQLNNPIGTQINLEAPTSVEELQQSKRYKLLIRDVDDPKRRKALLDILSNMALERAPEIQSLVANQNASLEQVKLYQRSRFIPTVAFQGSYDYRVFPNVTGVQEGYYTLALNLSLPIYQGGQRQLNKQKARIQANQLQLTTENARTQIQQNVSTIFNNMVSNLSNIHYSSESVTASKESLNLMQIAYESGAVSITSLIDAQSSYIVARSDNETALFNFLATSLQLERTIGYFFSMQQDINNETLLRQIDQLVTNKVNQK